MRFARTLMATFAAALLLAIPHTVLAQEVGIPAVYEPEPGDEVVIYIHRFNPQDYERGRDLVIDGFTDAIEEHGQQRRTFFMVNPAEYEVLVISFFHADGSVDAWHETMGRAEVLAELEPLRREPIVISQYRLAEHHRAGGSE